MSTRSTHLSLLALAVTMGLMAAHAQAQSGPNLIANGSFEAPSNVDITGYCYGSACGVSDWTLVDPTHGGAVLIGANNADWGTPSSLPNANLIDGDHVLGLQANGATLSQTLTLGAGVYELSWVDANRSNYGSSQSYQVSFNGVQLGTDFSTVRNSATGWQAHSLSFTLAQGATADLSFQGLSAQDATSFIDNVSLKQTGVVAAVPEPQTYALMAACLGVLGLSMRKRIGA